MAGLEIQPKTEGPEIKDIILKYDQLHLHYPWLRLIQVHRYTHPMLIPEPQSNIIHHTTIISNEKPIQTHHEDHNIPMVL